MAWLCQVKEIESTLRRSLSFADSIAASLFLAPRLVLFSLFLLVCVLPFFLWVGTVHAEGVLDGPTRICTVERERKEGKEKMNWGRQSTDLFFLFQQRPPIQVNECKER